MSQPSFGELLRSHLDRRGLTLTAWAKQVACAHSLVSHITRGERTPPLDRMPAWADALKLQGKDRDQFMELAALAHAPARIHALVQELRREVGELRKEQEEMQRLIAELERRRGAR